MKKNTVKRVLSVLVSGFFCTMLLLPATAADKVKPSEKAYSVSLYKANDIFISNKTAVNASKGEAIYLTYTVDSISSDESGQHGIVVTQDRTDLYPYDKKGVLQYRYDSVLLTPGNTYVFKFEVTEHGFEYVAAYGNTKDEDYIVFDKSYGEVLSQIGYAGVWIGSGAVTGNLSHVHCYDSKGNDLGVAVNNGNGATVYEAEKMNPGIGDKIEHSYDFQLKDAMNVAISNGRYTDSKVVYMEYTVKDVKENLNQIGACMSNSPTSGYPHAGNAGFLRFNQIPDRSGSFLLVPGAKYLVRFERTGENFDVMVRYTVGGVTRYATFINEYGSYSKDYGYCSLWLGEDVSSLMTAKFTGFKCYDAEGNNLAVQLNQEDVEIIHHGGLEDYSVCEGVYYCAQNHTYITLGTDRSAVKAVEQSTKEESGTYKVDGTELTMTVGNEKETYRYVYVAMTDESGNRYVRLKEEKAAEPGTEGEQTYVQTSIEEPAVIDKQLVVTIAVCAVLIIGTAIGGVLFMRGGKKHEK